MTLGGFLLTFGLGVVVGVFVTLFLQVFPRSRKGSCLTD